MAYQYRKWWNLFSYKTTPAKSYGFAIDEKGICVTAHETITPWVIGKHIEHIKEFLKYKKVDLTEIETYESNNNCGTGVQEMQNQKEAE